ncbi:MAG: alanine dehydrogenase [Lentisphaerae bacterium]|nr:alanine dehydrogenase [Lentisphaerota bacterium]
MGVPKEIKRHEYRVGATPNCVAAYVSRGHSVWIERGAGERTGYPDAAYVAAGAVVARSKEALFAESGMIIKVKEPVAEEYGLFRKGQLLYTFLHLAADRPLTESLLTTGVDGVAYETIRTADGLLPCLAPMSEIAGRLATQEGAKCLEIPMGGRGILLGGVPGVARGTVLILGGGVVGRNACQMAVGLGARVTVMDINASRLSALDDLYGNRVDTRFSSEANLEELLPQTDLLIGAVLIPGARAPHLVRREHLALMKPGSVIVDVAVDQGGCVETTRPTTHDDPVFVVDGVLHYCVANMPGAVALTATQALTNATLPYGLLLADKGVQAACRDSAALRSGLNTYRGLCTCPGVAEAFGLEYVDTGRALERSGETV